jgi:hypothetical protein
MPSRYATGSISETGLAAAARLAISRIGAVRGDVGSVADDIPRAPGPQQAVWLVLTDHRALLFDDVTPDATIYWQIPRALVSSIERRPRLQQLVRFRMHFTDGSSAAFLTRSAPDVRALRGEIAPKQPPHGPRRDGG